MKYDSKLNVIVENISNEHFFLTCWIERRNWFWKKSHPAKAYILLVHLSTKNKRNLFLVTTYSSFSTKPPEYTFWRNISQTIIAPLSIVPNAFIDIFRTHHFLFGPPLCSGIHFQGSIFRTLSFVREAEVRWR